MLRTITATGFISPWKFMSTAAILVFGERDFSLNINVLTARLVQSLKCDRRLEGKCASSLMIAAAREEILELAAG